MSEPQAWSTLSWKPDWSGVRWLEARALQVAGWIHAFEQAVRMAESEGSLNPAATADALFEWKSHAAHVWMYLGLIRDKQLGFTHLELHADELSKVYGALTQCRRDVLRTLGSAPAQKFESMERAIPVAANALWERALRWVNPDPQFGKLGEELPAIVALAGGAPTYAPLSSEEVRLRWEVESRALPSTLDIASLLQFIPRGWVSAIHQHLGLARVRRRINPPAAPEVLQFLTNAEQLTALVRSLSPAAKTLLAELSESAEPLSYEEVCARHGSDAGDGYYWLNRPPSGALAHLRRRGLAFVGNKGNGLVVTVAFDLTPTVLKALSP